MSNIISNSDFATAIVDNINEAAGDNVLTDDMFAGQAIVAINEAADGTPLTDAMSATQFIDAVNQIDFDGGGEATEVLRLLHISDTHGYADGLEQCKTLLQGDSGISHLVVTGDMTQYGTAVLTTDTLTQINAIRAMGDRILLCAGNHDSYDNTHQTSYNTNYREKGQAGEQEFQKNFLGNHVVFGDTSGFGCYYYKDIAVGTKTVRIISLDQYEVGRSVPTTRNYTIYSQAQIDWLMTLLANTPSSYYIIMLTHEAPVQSPPSGTTDTWAISMRPTSQEEANGIKLFTSETHGAFNNQRSYSAGNYNLLPRIMRAYLHKESINFTYSNYTGSQGTLTVQKSFTGEPAKLLFWMCGHRHSDCHGYIPYPESGWDDQLMFMIAAGHSSIAWAPNDDLLWNINTSDYGGTKWATNEPTYRFNEITIDFDNETIKVKRYGNKTTAEYATTADQSSGIRRTYGGRVRDEVTFPLTKQLT